jgi:beta-glucanase (GH16 family)
MIIGTEWTQVWNDTFNGPAGQGVSTANWKYDTGQGTFGTGEVERMTDSTANVHTDGQGNLDIVPLRGPLGWTSGRIQTTRAFAAPAGGEMMITASVVQPNPTNGIGYWPGFWLIAPQGPWPGTGEIDILEDVNAAREVAGTLHCGNLTQHNADGTTGPCHEGTGLTSQLRPCPDCQSAYNTYSLVIDRRNAADESVSWYFDGNDYFTAYESQVGAVAWTEAIDHGFAIILDVAIGGGFPNVRCQCISPQTGTTSGAPMGIGYVSVYTN